MCCVSAAVLPTYGSTGEEVSASSPTICVSGAECGLN